MASVSISCNSPFFTFRSSLSTKPLPRLIAPTSITTLDRHRPTISVKASAGGGKRRYKGTVQREEALSEMIEKKVAEAREACEGDEGQKESDGCRVAWDEVEEVSQAKADFRRRLIESGDADPLESFCEGNPESDECVVYDD